MKKVIAILFLITFTSLRAQDFSFRGYKWGTDKQKILSKEKLTKLDKNNYYTTGKIAKTYDVLINYEFHNDKLVSTFYGINESHSNENLYIDDFYNVEKLLLMKYGTAISRDIDWSNDLYKNDPSYKGFAVSIGHLKYKITYKMGDTLILHVLSGDNYKIMHTIYYLSPKKIELLKNPSTNDL